MNQQSGASNYYTPYTSGDDTSDHDTDESGSESEYEDLRDETYTQPNNYISKLRKRQRNTI